MNSFKLLFRALWVLFFIAPSISYAECSGSSVVIEDQTFTSEAVSCNGDSSITVGPNVIIEEGATLTLLAPLVTLKPPFYAESGSTMRVETYALHDALSPEHLAVIDDLKELSIDFDDITLPNGRNAKEFILENDPDFFSLKTQISGFSAKTSASTALPNLSPEETKNLLIAEFFHTASVLVDRDTFTYEATQDSPYQHGLGYSYNSKDYSVLQVPPPLVPPDGNCTTKIYGLDCSGFLMHIFKGADIELTSGNAWNQRQVSTLNKALIGTKWDDKLRAVDLGEIPLDDLESGDIVYWHGHIGMVLVDKVLGRGLYHSPGTKDDTNADCKNNCERNYTPRSSPNSTPPFSCFNKSDPKYSLPKYTNENRGPKITGIDHDINYDSHYWFGIRAGWKVVRYTAPSYWDGTYVINSISNCGSMSSLTCGRIARRALTGQSFAKSVGIKFRNKAEFGNLRRDFSFGGNAGHYPGCESHKIEISVENPFDLKLYTDAEMHFVPQEITEKEQNGTFTASVGEIRVTGTWSASKKSGFFGKCLTPVEGDVCREVLSTTPSLACLISCDSNDAGDECKWEF